MNAFVVRAAPALAILVLYTTAVDAQVAEAPRAEHLELVVRVEPWRDATSSSGDLFELLAPALQVELRRPSSFGDHLPSLQLVGVRLEDGRVVSSRRSRPFVPAPNGGTALRLLGKAELQAFLLGCCAGARAPMSSVRALPATAPLEPKELEELVARIARTGAINGVLFSGREPLEMDWSRQAIVLLSAVPERGDPSRVRPLLLLLEFEKR